MGFFDGLAGFFFNLALRRGQEILRLLLGFTNKIFPFGLGIDVAAEKFNGHQQFGFVDEHRFAGLIMKGLLRRNGFSADHSDLRTRSGLQPEFAVFHRNLQLVFGDSLIVENHFGFVGASDGEFGGCDVMKLRLRLGFKAKEIILFGEYRNPTNLTRVLHSGFSIMNYRSHSPTP